MSLRVRLSRVLERAAWNAHGDEEPPIPWRTLTLVLVAALILAALYAYEYTH